MEPILVGLTALYDYKGRFTDMVLFYISDVGRYNFKITLNPKNNYSVSQEFEENFNKETILNYEIVIENNEIIIKKIEE